MRTRPYHLMVSYPTNTTWSQIQINNGDIEADPREGWTGFQPVLSQPKYQYIYIYIYLCMHHNSLLTIFISLPSTHPTQLIVHLFLGSALVEVSCVCSLVIWAYRHIYIYICLQLGLNFVCVCVRERERDWGRGRVYSIANLKPIWMSVCVLCKQLFYEALNSHKNPSFYRLLISSLGLMTVRESCCQEKKNTKGESS